MAYYNVICAALLLAACVSAQQGGYGGYGGHQEEHYEPAHYSYGYAVKDEHTKDVKEHKETRVGDKTEGEYSLLEADGTTRIVKYVVDGKSGFVAQVIRKGHAVHAPQQQHYVAQPIVVAKPVIATYHAAPQQAYGHASSYVSQSHNVVAPRVAYASVPRVAYAAPQQSYGNNHATSYVSQSHNVVAPRVAAYVAAPQQSYGSYGQASSYVSGGNFGLGGGRGASYGGYRA